ncbi:hypothetical protein DCAR_0830772 [Daucus carota subsp. sativus]|uniref:DCD domain-containing protein n=1 Tax=Daucus carota subsp. sativus TaxID=79200 RepID=A0AAF0XND5_DAUCS|nr:PREDICTED: uncharacterized protein LOC108197284 [Daucus carota subsp. sativus]WOH11291.1 hypothetical protein DCAR_0830772 [Daucus carota subsp. sativus]
MARGKKNKKQSVNQKFQPAKANISAPARNLRKSELGAVIFGCKNHTIHECYKKKLFGLPAPHYAYVKNISRGLVLFLFNYSDRTLHGIFEAATPGEMNIDRHAWTEDGVDTPYPAQVKVSLHRRCCTLTEDQFIPIISSNYYEQGLFWFELDRSQTSKLVSLFNSLPCDADASTSQSRVKWNPSFNPLPASDTLQVGIVSGISSNKEVVRKASASIPEKTSASLFESSSYTDVMHQDDARKTWTSLFKSSSHSDDSSISIPQKTWSSLFKSSSDSKGLEKDEIFGTEAFNSSHPLDESKNLKPSCLPSSDKETSESERDVLNIQQCSEDIDDWETKWENPPSLPLSVAEREGLNLDASQYYDDRGNWESDWENPSALKEVSNFSTDVARHENRCYSHVSSNINTHNPQESDLVVGLRSPNVNEERDKTKWENPPSPPLSVADRQGLNLDGSPCYDDRGNWDSDRETQFALKDVSNFSTGVARHEDRCYIHVESNINTHYPQESDLVAGFWSPNVNKEGVKPLNVNEDETQSSDSFDFSAVINEMILEENKENNVTHTGLPIQNVCYPMVDSITATNSFDIQSVLSMLMKEIDGLKGFQLQQHMQINYLHAELVDSKRQIAQLKNRCNMLESGEYSSAVHLGDEYEWVDKSISNMNESILIVGGFDGSSWLADLNSYCLASDIVTPLCPMPTRRSYASAAKLGGELYIFGGIDGEIWHDTVESYNLRSDRWVSQPSLNRKKGSLAGVNLSDKIYAIGGGNGVDCLSEVEMYDPNIGRWIFTPSMQYKRFAPAASEINNALYVTGGYDGTNYLSTIERFDPRERSWVRVGNMRTKRGCHSSAVLTEKLYAFGGCDEGDRMHSTLEIFDPRMNSWMLGEPMNNSRGFADAVVVGGKLYVIGGLKRKDEILDTIECYKEGYGWEVTNLNALGKICFFSAMVF